MPTGLRAVGDRHGRRKLQVGSGRFTAPVDVAQCAQLRIERWWNGMVCALCPTVAPPHVALSQQRLRHAAVSPVAQVRNLRERVRGRRHQVGLVRRYAYDQQQRHCRGEHLLVRTAQQCSAIEARCTVMHTRAALCLSRHGAAAASHVRLLCVLTRRLCVLANRAHGLRRLRSCYEMQDNTDTIEANIICVLPTKPVHVQLVWTQVLELPP